VLILDTFKAVLESEEVFGLFAGHWSDVFRGYDGVDVLAEITDKFYGNHQTRPSYTEMRRELDALVLRGSDGNFLRPLLEKMEAQPLPVSEVRALRSHALEFARASKMKAELTAAIDALARDGCDAAAEHLSGALRTDTLLKNRGVGKEMYEYTNIVDRLMRWMAASHEGGLMPLSTGISELDEQIGGGIFRRELNVWMGPPKSGKTAALIHLSKIALFMRKNTLYVSLEMSEEKIARRFDQTFTGRTREELTSEDVLSSELEAALRKYTGRLCIVHYPGGSIGVQDIGAIIDDHASRGFQTELLVVDYGDELMPSRRYNEKRHEHKDTFQELRKLADERNLYMWTATQAGRKGAQKEWLDQEDVAEAYGKAMVADLLVGGLRKSDDADVFGISLAANRGGRTGHRFRILQDLSRMQFVRMK